MSATERIKIFFQFGLRHKLAAAAIIFVIAAGGYYGYATIFGGESEIQYVFAQAIKDTLIISVSGNGQVSASTQLDIKPKTSGEAVWTANLEGKEVSAGTLLIQLDAREAEKAVRDAEVNLENARIALEKLRGPEWSSIPRNKKNAQDDLKKDYDDGFTDVADAFLDLPPAITGLKNVILGTDFSINQSNMNFYADAVKIYDIHANDYRDAAFNLYQKARTAYDGNFNNYRLTVREAEPSVIEALIDETYQTAVNLSDAIKAANNLIQFYKDRLIERELKPSALADTHLSQLDSHTGKINAHIAALLNIRNQIKNDKDAISNADLDIRSQELAVKQRENALFDAKERLSDYYIRAPFAGTIAKINIKKGESVSSSAAAATIITRQKIAEISLNEIDVAQMKPGQKTVLTFDAVPGLEIAGSVAQIDSVGTVSQGVVTYIVKIAFDGQDERIKPSMSVSASITIEIKNEVLLVPNSAIKQSGGRHYVEIMPEGSLAPVRQNVEIGLSNDSLTEIVSGLKEGDIVVARAVNPSAAASAQTQQNASFRFPGLPGAGGGSRNAR